VFELAALAYLIDMIFGEFPCKHPVVWMGEFISGFEQRFYRNRILSGALLVISLFSVDAADLYSSCLSVWIIAGMAVYSGISGDVFHWISHEYATCQCC